MNGVRARVIVILLALSLVDGCDQGASVSQSSTDDAPAAATAIAATATASASATAAGSTGDLVIVGQIVTMDSPAVVQAMLIEDGMVAATGTREEILRLSGDNVPVMDLGDNVAYPGFIDAHSHWIGDREYYHLDTPAAAIDAALTRGWTSISEQWVNPERLDELERLAADDALPLRVDAYLALNYGTDFLGDWYTDRQPGAVNDHLAVKGLKIHLDDGSGKVINWDPAELTAAIGRADDAGWQLSVHAMSETAIELLLDAYEAAIGADRPNPLHHRIEHAMQVNDDQIARLVAMDIATVIHLDGATDWILYPDVIADFDRDDPGETADTLARWRGLVDAGLHVASATDAPWTFPDLTLSADLGRPVDHIAAGMDGKVRTRPTTPSWLTDQLLTAEQGLRAVTADAAWALGDEDRGRLAHRTTGDVTVLSGDVLDATPDEIRAMTVVATIVGGDVVYCADPETCDRR